MFQDEARFGRISQPISCWAPIPFRPMIPLALVREFRYIYATVSPWDGRLTFMVTEKMNTINMNLHLHQLSKRFRTSFIVLLLDGASSHRSKELIIPDNISIIYLPPYSPELNPTEQIWRILRTTYFGNRYFDTLEATIIHAKNSLISMARNKKAIVKLTNWPWIKKLFV
jgi:transposase